MSQIFCGRFLVMRGFYRICLIFCLLMGRVAAPAGAATIPLASVPVGKVVAVNGQKFVKIGSLGSRGQFMALEKVMFLPPNTQVTTDCPRSRIIGTMQTWNECANLATPAPTAYTDIGCLVDERDGKPYEIRKFADGKCWMADNLRYGGGTDNCAGVDAAGYINTTYGGSNGRASPSNRFGAGTYGNCRDPSVGAATSSPCYNSTICGYYYNWQAAMQQASAYYGATYTGPTSSVQGICPAGWHVPTGNTGGEFSTLDIANGGAGTSTSTVNAASNFWRPGYGYKGVYAGGANRSNGSLGSQGVSIGQWSVTVESFSVAWALMVTNASIWPATTAGYVNNGNTVRCIKN